ncbi:MAG: DUF4159 domain-containing protein [Pseudomonadota bacterium]
MSRSSRFVRGSALLAGFIISLTVATASSPVPAIAPAEEFHFARMMYVDGGGGRRNFGGGGWWAQDWPEAETHFNFNLKRLTRISVGEPVTVRLTDDKLFEYPWLYATQTGYWDLDDEEVARLREYLLRGGFLMCDDFWGDEFQVFAEAMARVFPDRQMQQLHGDDAVLHVVFSIDESVQIPGLRHLRQLDSLPPPYWLGIYDDAGRMMVGINYNQDVGDSWEESNTPGYPEPMTAQGYRFGINYITYAMTH